MFENLRISNIKGLNTSYLLNLGKINVICGKNNSGKSTVLEGIEQCSTPGKLFKEEYIDDFFNQTLPLIGINPGTKPAEVYLKTLQTMVNPQKVWYPENRIEFSRTINDRMRSVYPSLYINHDIIGEAYIRQLIRSLESVVLIPPQRKPDLHTSINANQQITPSGEGILNYLFYASNQLPQTMERQVFDQIQKAFTTISSGYMLNILMEKNNQLTLRFSNGDRPWIDADACGLGLQDLLVILYFSIYPDSSIVLIEEPECHIHPDMQRRLLSFLRESISKQFFMTTHSNVFLNNALIDQIFFTHYDNAVVVEDATSRAVILNNLGYTVTDNLVSDLIILVEGPTDKSVIEEFLIKFGLFSSYDIKIWPLGGDIMDQLDLSIFAQKYSITALIDSDPGSKSIRDKFIENCDKYGIDVTRLERYSIENYFSIRALREVFKGQIPSDLTDLEPDTKLENQIRMNVKKNNWKIANKMTLDEIKDTDLYGFLEKVKQLCERTN